MTPTPEMMSTTLYRYGVCRYCGAFEGNRQHAPMCQGVLFADAWKAQIASWVEPVAEYQREMSKWLDDEKVLVKRLEAAWAVALAALAQTKDTKPAALDDDRCTVCGLPRSQCIEEAP